MQHRRKKLPEPNRETGSQNQEAKLKNKKDVNKKRTLTTTSNPDKTTGKPLVPHYTVMDWNPAATPEPPRSYKQARLKFA